MKVPLDGIGPAVLEAGGVLEARVPGTGETVVPPAPR